MRSTRSPGRPSKTPLSSWSGTSRPTRTKPLEASGVLDVADLEDRYRGARVLLTASRYEGRPTAVIEAMAVGVPVCGYDVAGMRELVRTGRDGILARAGDVDDLATCLGD